MPNRPKRSERLAVNLTPHQKLKLDLAARTAKKTPAGYAHQLVCQALETDAFEPLTEVSETPEWVDRLGELYGILDALTQKLATQLKSDEEASTLHPLLTELKDQIEDVQATLISLPLLEPYR
jgi:hypothetical protein